MLLIRVACRVTIRTKAEHREPVLAEPVFREGDRMVSQVHCANGVAVLPESARGVAAELLLVEETWDGYCIPHPYRFQPPGVERHWSLFGLRMAADDAVELWLRDGRGFFYGAPRRAEYRLAILRPGEITRVLHNAKNDFTAARGAERTYRMCDFVFEPLGRAREIQFGAPPAERVLPLAAARFIDLRERLL